MAQFLFRVADLFPLASRNSVIVGTDCPRTSLPATLKIGDRLEFRRSDGTRFNSTIAGIALGGNPERSFDFLLPPGVDKEDIEIGAEIWSVD